MVQNWQGVEEQEGGGWALNEENIHPHFKKGNCIQKVMALNYEFPLGLSLLALGALGLEGHEAEGHEALETLELKHEATSV